jgi:diacylglycerol kinase (ATP)
MRAAAIFGLGCSPKDLKPFQSDPGVEWRMGTPSSADQADVILLFGGDGTIHRHLGQLVRLGLPVLLVPAGSGNDFARALGLRRVRDSLVAWRKFCAGAGNLRSIDLGVISAMENAGGGPAPHDRYFCSVAGVGLDADVARRANRLPRWLRGHGGYLLSLAPAIFSFAPVAMKILTVENRNETPLVSRDQNSDWSTRSHQPALLAAFANTPLYGGGMQIAPLAQIDDGLLDVCVVGAVAPFRLLRLFPSVYSGKHLKIREVSYFQATWVRVETEHLVDVYADGEYVCRTPIEVSVHRAALKVVTL